MGRAGNGRSARNKINKELICTTAGMQLRKLIEAPEITVLPGVHDTLSGLIAQTCGAKAIAAGGYSATAFPPRKT